MITNFKLFENINNNLPEEFENKLYDSLSYIVYKGNKRNQQKHKNYKSIRIKNIDGYYNENSIKSSLECSLNIEMNNKDKIEAKYIKIMDFDELTENSIYVKINDKLKYHMDNEKYDLNQLIIKIDNLYKKELEKIWKIK